MALYILSLLAFGTMTWWSLQTIPFFWAYIITVLCVVYTQKTTRRKMIHPSKLHPKYHRFVMGFAIWSTGLVSAIAASWGYQWGDLAGYLLNEMQPEKYSIFHCNIVSLCYALSAGIFYYGCLGCSYITLQIFAQSIFNIYDHLLLKMRRKNDQKHIYYIKCQ